MTNPLTGTCGRPLAEAVHVGLAALKFVVFQMLDKPKAESVTKALSALVGSTTVRAIKLFGTTPPASRLVSVDDPVVVPNRPPLVRPTIRTASFWGAMPIALIATPDWIGSWLTFVMFRPASSER